MGISAQGLFEMKTFCSMPNLEVLKLVRADAPRKILEKIIDNALKFLSPDPLIKITGKV